VPSAKTLSSDAIGRKSSNRGGKTSGEIENLFLDILTEEEAIKENGKLRYVYLNLCNCKKRKWVSRTMMERTYKRKVYNKR